MRKNIIALFLILPALATASKNINLDKASKPSFSRDISLYANKGTDEKLEDDEETEGRVKDNIEQTLKRYNNSKKNIDEKSKVEEGPDEKESEETLIKGHLKGNLLQKRNSIEQPSDTSNLSTVEKNWFYKPRNDGKTPEEPKEVIDILKKYNGYYVGDTSKKVLYLTFDEGYENGYTAKILDILKANNVKAAFFVTVPFMKTNNDLIKRMVDEGHLVCNHSTNHPSMASVAAKDRAKFDKEFSVCEATYEEITGKKMPKFFRPPMGKYSELSMKYTKELGYKTIFWSFAYADWEPNKQPSHAYAKEKIMSRTHDGSIVLLHAVSKTNAEIMDSIIKEWKSKGYEFKTLNDLP